MIGSDSRDDDGVVDGGFVESLVRDLEDQGDSGSEEEWGDDEDEEDEEHENDAKGKKRRRKRLASLKRLWDLSINPKVWYARSHYDKASCPRCPELWERPLVDRRVRRQ